MKTLTLFLLLIPVSFIYSDDSEKEKAAKAEKVIRQQRELEADQLAMKAAENFKTANYEASASELRKAIDLYNRASSSEQRILNKIKETKQLLSKVYRKYGDATLKEAEKRQSVELFNKAEKLYLLAKKTQLEIKKSP